MCYNSRDGVYLHSSFRPYVENRRFSTIQKIGDFPMVNKEMYVPDDAGGQELSASFIESLVSGEDINLDELGLGVVRLMGLAIAGLYKPSPLQSVFMRDMFKLLVAGAPKRVEVAHIIKPEEYIAEAIGRNTENYKELRVVAAEYKVLEEEKTLALKEFEETLSQSSSS